MVIPEDVRDRVVGYIQHQAKKSPESITDLVRTSQQKLLGVISDLSDERAATQPAAGEWSVRELVRHVIKAEIDVADIIAATSRGKMPAPSTTGDRGIGTMVAEHGQSFAALLDQVRETNRALLAAIAGVPASADIELKVPHPFFGPLNCWEWAVFQRVHDEDHAQHATKIVAAI